MSFAVLGNITFEAISSPESIQASHAWKFAEHPTVESTPKLQFIGNELKEISLEILLHVSFASPASDTAALEAAAEAHQAMALIFGNGDHWGYYVITKLTKNPVKLAADGSIIAITLKLELKQWVKSDALAQLPSPESAPGMIVGALAPGQSVAGVVAADGTVSFPAPQAGTSAIVSNPAASGAPEEGDDPDLVPTTTAARMDPSAGALLT